MKKMIMALCIFICAFTLVACSGQQTNEPLTLGVNAIITEIDKENKTITTKDSGEEGVLGNDCLTDDGSFLSAALTAFAKSRLACAQQVAFVTSGGFLSTRWYCCK